jgi:hypothetical protein
MPCELFMGPRSWVSFPAEGPAYNRATLRV